LVLLAKLPKAISSGTKAVRLAVFEEAGVPTRLGIVISSSSLIPIAPVVVPIDLEHGAAEEGIRLASDSSAPAALKSCEEEPVATGWSFRGSGPLRIDFGESDGAISLDASYRILASAAASGGKACIENLVAFRSSQPKVEIQAPTAKLKGPALASSASATPGARLRVISADSTRSYQCRSEGGVALNPNRESLE
jgi:hypothetical protein